MTHPRQTFFTGMYRSGDPLPWDRGAPNPLVTAWARDGGGRPAVVVGCGYGADAEYLAGLGWATTAFDFVPEAIDGARRRAPESTVDYRVADLLALPPEWADGFDLVLEMYTVQSLPREVRAAAIENVRSLVAPGGTLLVITAAQGDEPAEPTGPWPLTRAELDAFGGDQLRLAGLHDELRSDGGTRWRAEFTRPG